MSTGSNKTDHFVAVGKGVFGTIPVVGSLVAEVVGSVIPNQRMDRIAKLLEMLEARVDELEHDRLRTAFSHPGYVDLLEDGFFQAARALNDERIEHIANLLREGLSDSHLEYVELKKLLYLLNELNDVEVLILWCFGEAARVGLSKSEFLTQHQDTWLGPFLKFGDNTQAEIDKKSLNDAYRDHLAKLNLIVPISVRFPGRKSDAHASEFDSPELKRFVITDLGKLLLRHIKREFSDRDAQQLK